MYYFLVVYVSQPPGNVSELQETISSVRGAVNSRDKNLQGQTGSHPYAP